MFADPTVVKVQATNHNFVRTGITPNVGTFSYVHSNSSIVDGQHQLIVKQNETKARFRREVRRTFTRDYTDPVTGLVRPVSASVYVVVDEPKSGFTDDMLNDMWFGLSHLLTDTSFANDKFFQTLLGEY